MLCLLVTFCSNLSENLTGAIIIFLLIKKKLPSLISDGGYILRHGGESPAAPMNFCAETYIH